MIPTRLTLGSLLICGLLIFGCQPTPPDEAGLLDINGTQLYYSATGTGEPLLIIHGGPVLDQSYLVNHFAPLAKDYRLIFYDQRASGRSASAVDSASMTIKMFVEDIEGIRKKLNLGKISVLGHSWGGFLAVRYAAAYPGEVERLILSNPMPPSTSVWQAEEQELAKRITRSDSLQRSQVLSSEAMKNNNVSAVNELMMLSFKTQFADTTLLNRLTINLPADYFTRSKVFRFLFPELMNYDLLPEVQKIDAPTLVIYGDYEPAATLSGPLYEDNLTNGELAIISGSGHFPFIENPSEFFEQIRRFISEKR
jgi:proline iminopeptidase